MTVQLVPLDLEVARAVLQGHPAGALEPLDLRCGRGWPHADTADVLRPAVAQGDPVGAFLVVRLGEVIGECGWRGRPDAAGEVEISYGLAPGARGRGHGTAAVRALLTWLEQRPEVRHVRAEVLQGNEASRRLLERLGFALAPKTSATSQPYVAYLRDN